MHNMRGTHSLNQGRSTKMSDWMLMSTCRSVLCCASHPGPFQVPSRLRHTLPSAYRLGLNRTRPPPVVKMTTRGGLFG